MDKSRHASYLGTMFGRVIALLAILSFAVITAVTAAHAARATVDGPVAGHSGHTMTAGDTACGASQPCSPDDAATCAAICAGLPSCLAQVSGDVFAGHVTARQVPPAEAILQGHSPGLNDQPPKTRLL